MLMLSVSSLWIYDTQLYCYLVNVRGNIWITRELTV